LFPYCLSWKLTKARVWRRPKKGKKRFLYLFYRSVGIGAFNKIDSVLAVLFGGIAFAALRDNLMIGRFQTPTVFTFCIFINFEIHKIPPMNEYTFPHRFNGKSRSLDIQADNLNGTGKISDCPKNAQYDGKVLTKIYAPVNISQIKKCIGRLNFE
jgi:conserved hypothetical protein